MLRECHRVLKDEGLLVFSYHHSREEGWQSLAKALSDAGFVVVNCQPVKAEMSVATPKSQATEPIQLDIIVVCRKRHADFTAVSIEQALARGHVKLRRLANAGFALSRNDRKVVLFGQLLTAMSEPSEIAKFAIDIDGELNRPIDDTPRRRERIQRDLIFRD